MGQQRVDARSLAAIATTLVFWASAFAAIRVGLESYGPGELALLRFGTASIVLGGIALVMRMRLPRGKDLPGIFLCGFLGITVYHVALNFGEVTVSAGAASLLIAAVPVVTALLAVLFLHERLSVWGWVGIAVSFAGVALIALGEGGGVRLEPGAGLVLLAAVSTSVYFVLQKPYLKRYGPLEFTSYAIWAGTLLMLVFLPGLLRQIPEASTQATVSGIYLGVFPAAIAYVTWTYAMSKLPASVVTPFLYASPALAILIAWVWIGEVPTVLTLAGGTLAVAGVVVVNTWGRGTVRAVAAESQGPSRAAP